MTPYVPLWFRRALPRLNPRLVLRYIPPSTTTQPGVNPNLYPQGVWDICWRSRSGGLHPVAVWSLADLHGNYSPPGPDTIKLLRRAMDLHRQRRTQVLYDMRDRALAEAQNEKARNSKEGLRRAMARYCSLRFERRSNRVFLRRE